MYNKNNNGEYIKNINNLEVINKFIQGSIWKWESKSRDETEGVQSSYRPVLIISNNTFNDFSPSVNCITITSQLKDSPVHVPIFLEKDSHLQCEQIHTVSKTELIEYMGIASNSTMSTVKAKLKIQLDMGADKSIELLSSIKKSVDLLNDKVDKNLGGIPIIEDEILKMLINFESIVKRFEIEKNLKTDTAEEINTKEIVRSDDFIKTVMSEETSHLKTKKAKVPKQSEPEGGKNRTRRSNRQYTEEDMIYISDNSNSIESLMEKYGYNKANAHRMRWYFKNKLNKKTARRGSNIIKVDEQNG